MKTFKVDLSKIKFPRVTPLDKQTEDILEAIEKLAGILEFSIEDIATEHLKETVTEITTIDGVHLTGEK